MTASEAKGLLSLRKRHKRTKPEFVRQESWKYTRLSESWRKARGKDNKTRLKVKGWPKPVRVGYGTPKVARDLHPSGLRPVLISCMRDLKEAGSPEGKILILSSKLGKRSRRAIAKEASSKGFVLANYSERDLKVEEA
ncbi:MAG: 50S ribosomal protein L32e [Thermoproteota archaeon]